MLALRSLLFAVVTASVGFVGCADEASETSGAESELVNNDAVVDMEHDGRPLRLIAEYFGARGLDLNPNPSALDLAWPIAGKAKALNRFGTPQLVLNRGYFHTALDVIRESTSASNDVFAPVSGQLMVFDTFGAPRLAPVGYGSIVAIYDSASHLVVTLLHVMPTAALSTITGPVPITKGALVGTLAPPSLNNFPAVSEFHHTHLNVIDGRDKKLLDPVPLLPAYRDSVKPSVEGVYLLDELGARNDALHTGRLDVVVDAFDRDDESARNLEIAAIAYEIKDGAGNVLRSSPRCNFRDLFESIASPYSERALSLVDFGNALSQRDNKWPNGDLGNPNRRFRYVLTHLAVKDGRCTTLDDADGHVDVADDVSRLDVQIKLWDPSGNVREHGKSITRDPNAHDPPRRLVTFEVENATTIMGQNVYVVGDAPQIGSWNPRRASKLSPSAYPTWAGKAWLPVGATVKLKFIKIAPGAEPGWDATSIPEQRVTWESGDNRSVVIPAAPEPALVRGTWR